MTASVCELGLSGCLKPLGLPHVARFFTHYSPQVPVVDRLTAADAIFEKSPFLFWTIVTIGSRKYSQDPTLFSQLCHRIVDLAFSSLKLRQSPIQIVQALVLLCAWPLPVEHLYQDKVHTLAGSCMQLALQIGLHVAGVGQDFARERVQAHAAAQAVRALLWRYCVIVCQRFVRSHDDVPNRSAGRGLIQDLTVRV